MFHVVRILILTHFSTFHQSFFQEKVIPEENEEDDEEASDGDAGENVPVSVDANNSPYTSAIEGYKSFAKSKLNGSDSGLTHSDRDDSDRQR